MTTENRKRKVIIIGLDGACWYLLRKFMKKGELNYIKKLMQNGAYGYLESCIPFVTYPSWKCYSTGKNPGKLGVYGMAWIDFSNRRIRSNNSKSFKSLEYWDYLGYQGFKVGIIDMPTMYPPKKVNGFIIGDPFSIGKKYTYPSELQKVIEEKYNYKIIPKFYLTKDKEDIDEAKEVIKTRFDIAKELILDNRVDLLHITIFFTDTIQHFLWDSEETRDIWKFIDEEIGNLLEFLDDRWIIFLISDHGFAKINAVFYLSTWLRNRNYFKIKNGIDIGDVLFTLDKFGLKFNKIVDIILKLHLDKLLTKIIPREFMIKIWRKSPGSRGRKLEGMESKIDWENSPVIPLAPHIYLNPNYFYSKSDVEKEKFIETLVRELEEVKDPITGEKIIRKVWRREELYKGEYIKYAPEIIIQPKKRLRNF